jgi:CHAT domain-containing protein
MTALVRAYAKRRLIEARLSGGFLAGTYRSGDSLDSIDVGQLETAVDMIGPALAEGDDLQATILKGRLLVAQGKNTDALRTLRAALRTAPSNAEVYNDLGACLYAGGDFDAALDQFETALKLRQTMPEALFNRALCYQRLQLSSAARFEFSKAAETERDQGWLREIRDRLDQLSQPVPAPISLEEVVKEIRAALSAHNTAAVAEFLNKNTSLVLTRSTHLYDQYLEAAVSNDFTRAEEALSELEQIGAALRDARGDKIVADLASYFRGLPRRDLAEEKLLQEEWKASLKRMYSDSSGQIPLFARFIERFGARGNRVLQHRAGYNLAVCLSVSNRFTESLKLLVQQVQSAEEHKWYYYEELAMSQMALNYSRLGQDSLAIRYCSRVSDPSRYSPYFEAKASQYIGLSYWHLGDLDRALLSLRKSTDIFIRENPIKVELSYNYLNIGDIYRLRGSHRLAKLYAEAALAFAKEANNGDLIAQSSSFAALEMAATDEPLRAREHLQLAFDFVSKMDPGQRRFTGPLVYLRGGTIAEQQGDAQEALGYYSKAQEDLNWPESDIALRIEALRGQSKTLVSEGRISDARSALQRAIDLIEYQRGRIAESENRSHYLDATRGVFDEVISLNASEGFGSPADAFDLSERSRARTLFDEISTRNKLAGFEAVSGEVAFEASRTLSLDEIRRVLPQDLALLEFAVTSKETSIFVITKSEVAIRPSTATAATLQALVTDYLNLVGDMAPINEVTEKARYLYDLLIGPVEPILRDKFQVAIVPDESLHFLPFAALVDRAGTYLVQTHSLTYAPSASVLVECLNEARLKKASGPERVVAVGNPAYDTRVFPQLRPLPDAEVEAAQVAGLYPGARLLIGTEATKNTFQSVLADCDIAHLALHCVIDELSPGEARLVLASAQNPLTTVLSQRADPAPPRSDDSVLSLTEVYRLRLRRTRLVILSACQSGVGQYYRGEGIVSLVYPFIVASVPTVVASLWSVQSEATSQLMYAFHLARTANKARAGEALRTAQMRMSGDDRYRHPFYWAAFVAVGSDR